MGYVQTDITIIESDGLVQVAVPISMPSEADPIETSFYLLVNTLDGSATGRGLPQSLMFDSVPIHFSGTQSLAVNESCNFFTHIHMHARTNTIHTYIHTHIHTCTRTHTIT